jgi:hypothetical protein
MLLQKRDLTDMLMYIAGKSDNCQSDRNLSCIPCQYEKSINYSNSDFEIYHKSVMMSAIL